MTREELIDEINNTVDSAIANVNKNMPAIQNEIFDEIQNLARELDYKNNRIAVSVKNTRVISAISKKLRRIILTSDYGDDTKEFLKAFNTVTSLQNQYLTSVTSDFSVGPVLRNIKFQAIADTAFSLTQEGLNVNVVNALRAILQKNVTTGGTFKELLSQAKASILDTDASQGLLSRYVKGVTTDALNQYSRNYLQVATDAIGYEWYQYTGSLITTSRTFCIAMVKKRFFNIKEVPDLLKGNFKEFEDLKGTINKKTGLPDGMIEGTNVANFLTLLGGYTCGHRAVPVSELIVPKKTVQEFKDHYS
jgi:hypothetical protein